jgi:hypothetical protein
MRIDIEVIIVRSPLYHCTDQRLADSTYLVVGTTQSGWCLEMKAFVYRSSLCAPGHYLWMGSSCKSTSPVLQEQVMVLEHSSVAE